MGAPGAFTKWLGAAGAAFAALMLAFIGIVFMRGGTAVMDDVPWGLVLLVALLAILALAGVKKL